jgi:Ras-related protein Rab-1A
MKNNQHYSFGFRVCLVGDSQVGKSELLRVHTQSLGPKRTGNYGGDLGGLQALSSARVGVGINIKVQTYDNDDSVYRVQYWDCPGMNRVSALSTRLCAGAAAVMLVYDVSNFQSFLSVEAWLRALMEHRGAEAMVKVLVGNKADLSSDEREVPNSQGEALAKKHRMAFFETSVDNEEAVTEAFSAVLGLVTEKVPSPPEPSELLAANITIGRMISKDKVIQKSLAFPSSELASRPDWLE